MALARTNLLGQITASTGTSDFVTSAFTPPDNSLLVVAGTFEENSGPTTDPTSSFVISDSAGLAWTQRATAVASPTSFGTVIKVWTAPVTTGVSMTITLSTGGRNRLGYAISVVAYTGYDTSTPIGVTATGQQNGGFGTAPNPASITLSGAPASTSEVFAGIGIDKATADTTPGSTWTEVHDVTDAADDVSLESEVRTGSTSTTVDWVDLRPGGGNLFNFAAAAVEVRAAAAVVSSRPMPLVVRLPSRPTASHQAIIRRSSLVDLVVVPTMATPAPIVITSPYRRVLGVALVLRTPPGESVSPLPCITERPSSGTTLRPDTGTTQRPNTGITLNECH